jgi:hypothetical protein
MILTITSPGGSKPVSIWKPNQMMRVCVLLILFLVLFGCGPQKSSIERYGVDEFRSDMFDQTQHEKILSEIGGKEIRPYLTGMLLITSESRRYISGIYVDKESLNHWGGSGLEIEAWYPDIGSMRIKVRQKPVSDP